MFVMPDIPFAVLVLFVLGYIIYRIVRKIKEYIERVKWELDDSPEALHIKARDKELENPRSRDPRAHLDLTL